MAKKLTWPSELAKPSAAEVDALEAKVLELGPTAGWAESKAKVRAAGPVVETLVNLVLMRQAEDPGLSSVRAFDQVRGEVFGLPERFNRS